jgi:glyoxylase-like metal-dependent hydrolase (beta-lactamase superfamily II)
LKPQEIADGIFTVTAGDHRALFVASGDGVVALNSFGASDAAAAYLGAISEVSGRPAPDAVIATIDHLDHSGRTAELRAGELLAHELCATVMSRRGAPGQRHADRLIGRDGETLGLAGTRLELLYLGPTQGTGNLAVHVPERRILFIAGPRADARYGLLPDFHLRHVTRIWRELARLDVDTVVPARGPLMTAAELTRAADYIDAVKRASQEAFAEGVPIWVIQAMEPFVTERLRERFGDLEGFERHIGITSIRVVHHYLMGGWGMEDTTEPDALFGLFSQPRQRSAS